MKNQLSILQFLRRFNDKRALLLLIMLLSADFVFILINAIIDLSPALRREDLHLFSISEDRSYSELFQYLKWFWITIILVKMSASRRSLSYLAWGLLTTYFLLDDSIGIHELFGKALAAGLNFTPPFSMRPQDMGELIVSGIAAIILLSPILLFYLRGNSEFKEFSRDITIIMALLFFFGIFLDMMAYALPGGEKMSLILGFTEDAGEMAIASLLLWYVFQSFFQEKGKSLYLFDYFRLKRKNN